MPLLLEQCRAGRRRRRFVYHAEMSESDHFHSKWGASALRLAVTMTWLILPVMLAVAAWTSQEFPNRNDRYLFEHMGQTLLAGGTMYLDCWDAKPPGLGWWNAAVLWVGGGSTYAITAAAALAGGLAVLVTAWGVASVLGRSAALPTAIVFAVVLSQRYFDALTNGTELYMMSAESIACALAVCAIRGAGRSAMLCAFGAGLAWGVAGLFKQPAIAGPTAAFFGVVGVALFGGSARRRWSGRLLLAGLGAAIVVVAAIAVLHHQGALREAYRAAIGVNLARQRPGHVLGAYDLPRSLAQLRPIAGIVFLALIGGVVSIITSRPRADRADDSSQTLRRLGVPTVVFLLTWLIFAAYWVGAGPSHMPRYWHGAFVPMMWLLAQGIVYLLEACMHGTKAGRYTVLVAMVALAIVALREPLGNIYRDALRAFFYAENESERAGLIGLAARIDAHTAPDDPIHVWGYNPGVYRFSGRRAISRFGGLETIYFPNDFGRAMAEEVFGDLRKHPPKLIIVERHRRGPLRADRLGQFQLEGLGAWFSSHYEEVETVGSFELFALRAGNGERRQPPDPQDDPQRD